MEITHLFFYLVYFSFQSLTWDSFSHLTQKIVMNVKYFTVLKNYKGFSGGASGKEPTCHCRRCKTGSIPGSGRPPGGGNDNPLQYSCLENPMDRGVQWATVHGVAELDMTTGLPKGLSDVDRPGRGESAVTGHQEDGQVPQGVFISSGRGSRL